MTFYSNFMTFRRLQKLSLTGFTSITPSIHCNLIATQKYSYTYVKYTAFIAFHFCSKFVDSFKGNKNSGSVYEKKEKYFTRVC